MSDPLPNEYTLKEGEYHPSANSAMAWYKTMMLVDPVRYMNIREAIASTALSGNRTAELCFSTMERLANGQPVSDRYLLGLCWFLRDMMERDLYEQNEFTRGKKATKVPKKSRQETN